MKKLVVLLMIAIFAATGCTGTFKLTRTVYKIHRDQEKWVDEALFLVFVIVPVYGLATFADAILFNTIEFWTGKNPLASNLDTGNQIAKGMDSNLSVTHDKDTGAVEVSNLNTGKSFNITRNNNSVVVKDMQGRVLYVSMEDSSGAVRVLDSANNTVVYFSPEEVQKKRSGLIN